MTKHNKMGIKIALFIFSILAISIGCNTKKDATNSPSFVLEQLKEQTQAGNIKEISKLLCEKDSKKLRNAYTIASIALGNRTDAIIEFAKNHLNNAFLFNQDGVTISNETVIQNQATITATKMGEKEKTFHFIKENNEWKLCKP